MSPAKSKSWRVVVNFHLMLFLLFSGVFFITFITIPKGQSKSQALVDLIHDWSRKICLR